MNYEVESKLNQKADKWELDDLRQELNTLKNENRNLRETIQTCESKFQNYYSAFELLQRILLDSGQMTETEDLHSLMQYL